jgi:hypothetical protein
MITCANCPADALFEYAVEAHYSLFYCQRHLPRFLANNPRLFTTVTQPAPVVEAVVPEPKPSKKKVEAVAPEEETPAGD